MSDLQDQFELRARLAADERRRVDFDDLQNERAGLETGRMARFLDADTRETHAGRGKGSDKTSQHLSRLQQLLATNPAYAALYQETFDKLRAAEAATEAALQKALALHSRLATERDAMLARAARLPDGTAVFRDANGTVWSEHWDEVTSSDLDAVVWPEDAPAYEAFRETTHTLANAGQKVEALRGYQVEMLGHVRERMTDEDDPPSVDEIEKLQAQIASHAPEAVQAELGDIAVPDNGEPDQTFQAAIPKIPM